MPAKSKAQQRFFGMVDACKKGEMKNPSKAVKKAAKEMTKKQIKDFASTKQKGLPEKVEENVVRLTNEDLNCIVKECVQTILGEDYAQRNNYVRDNMIKPVKDIMTLCNQYLQKGDESALNNLYWHCSSFVNVFSKANNQANQIYK